MHITPYQQHGLSFSQFHSSSLASIKHTMNKKNLTIDSPTVSGMEMQSNTLTATTTTTATATTSTVTLKTSVHVTALDGIVNVNSLFTMATFIGFSMTVPQAATAATRVECHASQGTVRRLIVSEVISFSFFLFSSLLAQSIKLSINLLNSMTPNESQKADIDPDLLKYGLFASAIGSVLGCFFLGLSIADFIQVKLGVFSCGGGPVYGLVALVVLLGSGFMVYVVTAVYAAFFVQVVTEESDEKSD